MTLRADALGCCGARTLLISDRAMANHRTIWARGFAVLLGLTAAPAITACNKSGPGPEAAGAEHPLVGSPAPEFELPAQHGEGVASLAAASGKVTIVDFWATWCEPCRMSFPKYEALQKKFGGDLVIVGVSEDDEPDGIAGFGEETGVSFALAWDRDKSVANSYSPDAMPTSFIVDKNGLIRFVHEGFHPGDEASIEAHVKSLL